MSFLTQRIDIIIYTRYSLDQCQYFILYIDTGCEDILITSSKGAAANGLIKNYLGFYKKTDVVHNDRPTYTNQRTKLFYAKGTSSTHGWRVSPTLKKLFKFCRNM